MFVNVEEMIVLRTITKYLFIAILLWLSSCNEQGNDELYGNWAVLKVYYGDEDISGINISSKVTLSTSMEIDDSKDIIFLPTNSDKTEYGYFKHYLKDEREWLRIYDSTDPRFNGEYLVHLKLESSSNKGKNSRHSLELESEDVYIYAIKMTSSL